MASRFRRPKLEGDRVKAWAVVDDGVVHDIFVGPGALDAARSWKDSTSRLVRGWITWDPDTREPGHSEAIAGEGA